MREFAFLPGSPYPLGATWDGSGVNFAVASENAEGVELCIFDQAYGAPEVACIPLREQTDYVWHVYLPEARPGLIYGYRVSGPFDPQNGHRFNPAKLLLDPYAKATTGPIEWSDGMFGYPLDSADEDRDLQMDTRDSAPGMSKAVVIEPAFSWGEDKPPKTPWHDTIIYEAHVKGLTRLHPGLPEDIRGTYAALADRRVVQYLQDLGITAIELMPVHHFVRDMHLADKGLSNYWGYNSLGFLALDPRYSASKAPGGRVNEFKTTVKTLHLAGIEVILDVVYNHTAEGNHLGPTLSFRGIDNKAYYRLVPGEERYYMDYTGTGNTLNMLQPRSLQLIMDSLRYWVLEMHVDGFRFDLASALARELHDVHRLSAFFEIIHQDPVLSQVKLIAEPWDVGEGGYQVGNFPVLWAEWNGRYRDCVRRYWRGDTGQVGELAYRLTGSSDLYSHNGRRPYASVNFVTAHDGFTLHDLVSYNQKHNESNGEEDRDGAEENLSWNCGVEGETDSGEVLELRRRQMRNFLTTLLVSQGVPMLLHGDEIARTQRGNNNAYCQDNEMSWMPWVLREEQKQLLEWTKRLVRFRKLHPALRRRRYFEGRAIGGAGIKDISWLRSDASEMAEDAWHDPETKALAVLVAGTASDATDQRNQAILDDTLLFLLNGGETSVDFVLPAAGKDPWRGVFDTSAPADEPPSASFLGGSRYPLKPRAMAVLVRKGTS